MKDLDSILNINSKTTKIIYFDECGDDGNNTKSSDYFVLTAISIDTYKYSYIFENIIRFRKTLLSKYGLYISEELHTKSFLYDKDPYRKYKWSIQQRKSMLDDYINFISSLDIKIINTVVLKKSITPDFNILKNALFSDLSKIEIDSTNNYKYLLITDKGRTVIMNKELRNNVIPTISVLQGSRNKPITNLVEDILEKDSKDSYFIQIADFISTFIYMYYKYYVDQQEFPKRLSQLVDNAYIIDTLNKLVNGNILGYSNLIND